MPDLDRFRRAQEDPHAGFAAALAELRAGRKTSHWIWYVFPQLAGLGRSPTATHFGLADAGEAAAYLRDPVLGPRLVEAVAAVHAHLTGHRPARLQTLMGSHVDALKLVSCLTLFRHVARALDATAPRPAWTALAAHADAILAAAAAQGYPPCRFTEARSSGSREPPPSGRCP
ncbi:MAG: hypothetical protein A2W08_17625 [Candidatus Rokubacteria bacterium RBG_16_73_20]|nr:MAG: hypothetical protein A2W08_17625 [Candidatus Rokubacteria bacterium RBG_16_73_20]HBH03381.1 hypothetical protein [Candidatus Rokubacteria bacterium]